MICEYGFALSFFHFEPTRKYFMFSWKNATQKSFENSLDEKVRPLQEQKKKQKAKEKINIWRYFRQLLLSLQKQQNTNNCRSLNFRVFFFHFCLSSLARADNLTFFLNFRVDFLLVLLISILLGSNFIFGQPMEFTRKHHFLTDRNKTENNKTEKPKRK